MSDFETFADLVAKGDMAGVEEHFKREYLEREIEGSMKVLHVATKCGHLEVVKFLCQNLCNIETLDKEGWRAIHYACYEGHIDIVKLLYEKKCSTEASNKTGMRPLHRAVEKGHVEIIQFLLEKKCVKEACNKEGLRSIHIACRNGDLGIIKLLYEQKCSMESSDKNGQRPIHYASRADNVEIFKFLCEIDCKLEQPDKFGRRPIHYACLNRNVEILKILLERNCNIEAGDKNSFRPIHYACQTGFIEGVKLLVENHCDIDVYDNDLWRPIHHACHNAHVDVVELLCENHCKIEARNKANKSPLDIVNEIGQPLLIDIVNAAISRKLADKINRAAKLKCDLNCDHKSCFKSLFSNELTRKHKIGNGTFGNVYKVRDLVFNLDLAMKSIHISGEDVNREVQYLELDICKYQERIKHERIVHYFGSVRQHMKMYIFMEYLPGGSIHTELDRMNTSFPHVKIVRYSQQILEGLEFLHLNKIIHRDIKPKNILLDTKDNIKLCDFGLSCALETILRASLGMLNVDDSCPGKTFVGTLNYMAPEIVLGQRYGYPVDIWAFGASMIEMLTGDSNKSFKKRILIRNYTTVFRK